MGQKFDITAIKKRADELEAIKSELKTYFVGLDTIIDEFINNVKIWYILPEIQTRPLIVNLWGMTGLGKTDLVRKFVNLSNFNDRFIEIQMDAESTSHRNNIQDYIENVLDNPNDEGILLLDEIQRFRTVDETGREIQSSKYKDLWMLLSDGKFESDSKNRKELTEMMYDLMYSFDSSDYYTALNNNKEEAAEGADLTNGLAGNKTKEKKATVERKYKTWAYSAKRLKKLLKLEETVDELMTWDEDRKMAAILNGLKSKTTFEGNVYSKLLVIISGNLDEAFHMAESVGEVDYDADLFHEFSKTVNILNIKKALNSRFKPEQIARFGNIHIIYPSLSKHSYYEIIKQKITRICDSIKTKNEIEIIVDESVYDVIYKNGVFPTQGVRPVLSTISSIFENSLPNFIYAALLKNIDTFSLWYDNSNLVSILDDEKVIYHIPRVIEDLKEAKSNDEDAFVAVHEAGHAVVYALLNKLAPTQITCNTAGDDALGFIGLHKSVATKEGIRNNITATMAGRAAEIIVFGKKKTTTGAAGDIKSATANASGYFRKFGFGDSVSHLSTPQADGGVHFNQTLGDSDKHIEELVSNSLTQAIELLQANAMYLRVIIKALFEKKSLTPDEFVEISKRYIPEIEVKHPKDKIIANYHDKMTRFIA